MISPGGAGKKAGWSPLSYSSGLSPYPTCPRPSTNPTSVLLLCPSGTHCPPSLVFTGSPGAQPHSCPRLHRATLVARSETPLLRPPGKQHDSPPPDPSPFASSYQGADRLPPGLSCGGNRESSKLLGPHRSFQAVPLSYPNFCSSDTKLFYTPALSAVARGSFPDTPLLSCGVRKPPTCL